MNSIIHKITDHKTFYSIKRYENNDRYFNYE